MYIRQSKKGWQLAAAALCAIPVVAIIPGCGGGGNSGAVIARQYTGDYTGTYSGSETGTFRYSVDSNNNIVATITSPSLGTVTGTGTLNNGNFSFGGTSTKVPPVSINFTGSYALVSGVQSASGTWQSSNGLSGSFTATKALGAPTPLPGPTFTPGPTVAPTATPIATATPAANQFAGHYTGSVTLNTTPIQNEAISFTVSANSSVGGTLQQANNSQVNLAGTANNYSGALNLSGSYVDASGSTQSISLTGRLVTQNGATTVVSATVRTAGRASGTWAATKR